MKYSGVSDFTGKPYSFELFDVELDDIEGNACVKATIKTELGEDSILEWVNSDGTVERIDSHIKINNDVKSLFSLEGKPSFMPTDDYIPFIAIFDALDNELSD
jgi:hypothetical protein